jgi:hypothetical protein
MVDRIGALAADCGLRVETRLSGGGRSDHVNFLDREIPAVHFSTGVHSDYHRVTDEAARIDSIGGARISWLAFRLVEELMTTSESLKYKQPARQFDIARLLSLVGKLGIIPALNAQSGKYPKIQKVVPGSLADKYGFKSGDEITAVNGAAFERLEDAAIAFGQLRFEDGLRVTVLREGKKLEVALPGEVFQDFFDPPEGFVSMFNGKDLTGWDGSPTYWKAENGILTGTADGTLKYNRFIIWRGGAVKNFEWRAKVRVTPGGNSGLQYRSVERPDLGESVMVGYQCDVVPNRADYNGMLYEERGRRILAHTGEKVIIDAAGQPWVVDKLEVKEFKPGEWHDFRVLVEGNHHRHWIDGHLTVDVIDLDEKGRKLEGLLGMQVHVGPKMTIEFKDLYLKKLADDLPLVGAAQAPIPASAVQVVPQGKDKKKK